jgi:hypothetical protein
MRVLDLNRLRWWIPARERHAKPAIFASGAGEATGDQIKGIVNYNRTVKTGVKKHIRILERRNTVKSPPWHMNLGITRWNTDPL